MKLMLMILLSCQLAMAVEKADEISGSWTYRSFHNNPEFVGGDPAKLASLLFGEGHLQLSVDADNQLSGTISFGANYILDLSGFVEPGAGSAPDLITMKGLGRIGTPTADWIYEYKAFPAPLWGHAIKQRPALVGTVVRTRHEPAQAGYTTSFIIVKQ